jgi:hypothetical protein
MIRPQESAISAAEATLERPRIVTIVGWVWLILAAMRCLEGVLGLIVYKVGGLDEGLPLLGIRPERLHLSADDVSMRYAVPMLMARVVLGGILAWCAFQLLRLKRWAWTAIRAASIAGILVSWAIGVYIYLSTVRMAAGLEGADPGELRMVGAGAGLLVGLLGTAFFGVTLFLLARPSVRPVFEPAVIPAP